MDMEFVIRLSDIVPFAVGFVIALTLIYMLRRLFFGAWMPWGMPVPVVNAERNNGGGCLPLILIGAAVVVLLLAVGGA
jgi:hypothetical protein